MIEEDIIGRVVLKNIDHKDAVFCVDFLFLSISEDGIAGIHPKSINGIASRFWYPLSQFVAIQLCNVKRPNPSIT